MWKSLALLLCMSSACCWAGPVGAKRNMPIVMEVNEPKIVAAHPLKKEEAADAEQQAVTTQQAMYMSTLTLPSNATSIRADITDSFSCENKTYGYYADVENDCQIFHVCLPVTYADGKENTFRWSFICPEETIFSQDSFTCMRPEDMTIDCEESAQYYELNRNFGMVEDESNKNNAESATMVTKPALNEPIEADIPQLAPAEEAEKPEMESAPLMSMPVKPIKVAKPNRRKPAHSSFAMQNKLTGSHPLRKIPPQTIVMAPVSEAEEAKPEVTEKPKFTKRPASMNNRDKVVSPTSSPPIRTELFNQNRKRPAYLNRKESVPKPAVEEPIVVADEAHVLAPVMVENSEEPVKAEEADAQQGSAEDTDTQASETAAIFVKPQELDEAQEAEKIKEAANIEKAEKVQEAEKIHEAEKIQEAEKIHEAEKIQEAEKLQEVEITQKVEMTEEVEKSQEVEKPQEIEMTQEVEQPQEIEIPKEVEADEAMPVEVTADVSPVIMENVEEPLPVQAGAEPEPEKDTPIVEEPLKMDADSVKPMEAIEEMPVVVAEAEEAVNEVSPSSPEEIAVDSASSPVEAIEESNPLDAMHAMPAISETEQADEKDQQMLVHQSVGGFKPVDSAMAAEAEALITDFINSLRKTESIPTDDSANNDVPVETLGEPDLFRLYSAENEATAETNSNEVSEAQPEDTKVPKIGEAEEDKKPNEINNTDDMEQVSGNLKADEAMNPMDVEKDADAPSDALEKESSENTEFKGDISEPAEVTAEVNAMPVEEQSVDAAEMEKAPEPQVEVDTKTEEKSAEMAESSEQSEGQAEVVETESKESEPIATEILVEPQMSNEQTNQTPEVAESSNNIIMMQQYPNEMMQIPVQIIEAPMEEVKQTPKTVPAEEQPKEESASADMAIELPTEKEIIPEAVGEPQMPLSLPHTTLSIDDIVELVKERLDQMPSGEKGIPMQMVMQSGEQPAASELKEPADEQKPQSADDEVIVMPIYHRVAEPEPSHEAMKLLPHEPQIHEQSFESIETVHKEEEQPQQSEDSTMMLVSGGEQLTEETESPVASDTETTANQKQQESVPEAMEVPSMKISRSIRARSISNAAMDPRKRRFLFRSDVN